MIPNVHHEKPEPPDPANEAIRRQVATAMTFRQDRGPLKKMTVGFEPDVLAALQDVCAVYGCGYRTRDIFTLIRIAVDIVIDCHKEEDSE